jgi:hypothetical protein
MSLAAVATLPPAHRSPRPASDDPTAVNRLALRRRCEAAKRAYTTRHVPLARVAALAEGLGHEPRPGDLVLARVQRIGKHAAIELAHGRRSTLFVGDEVIVAYAARYAPDQFLAEVPGDLGPCHLAAGGGVAALVTSRHGAVGAPTDLTPIGLLLDSDGERLNLARFGLQAGSAHAPRPLTILSLGTSMNAGKTTAAAYLVKGLARAGLRVGAAKLTGTGSGNDPGLLADAGAHRVLDFTDAGFASTFGATLDELHRILDTVQSAMCGEAVDVLVAEVADGLLQRETAMLLRSTHVARRVDGCLFSAGEAMGALSGLRWLHEQALPVLAVAGTLTRSPLARAEVEQGCEQRTLGLDELANPVVARELWRRAARASGPAGEAA